MSKPKNEWEIASVRWVPGTMKRLDAVLPTGMDRATFIRRAVDDAIRAEVRRLAPRLPRPTKSKP